MGNRGIAAPMTGAGVAQAAPAQAPRVEYCKKEDIRGRWKLKRIFETPEGAWTEDFRTNPHQYRHFVHNGIYYDAKGSNEYKRPEGITKALKANAHANNQQQYVVGERGLIYIYRNGVHINTLYCGIVRETRVPYVTGDIVLTPAQQSSAQIYMIYSRPFAQQQQPGFAPPQGMSHPPVTR